MLERLDRFDKYEGFWLEAVVEDRRTPVPDQVWFRIDFPQWLSRLSTRDRRIAEALAAGSRPGEVAEALGVRPAQISQKRRQLYDSWCAFHGEGDGTANVASAIAIGVGFNPLWRRDYKASGIAQGCSLAVSQS